MDRIVKPGYTIACRGGGPAEITLYGEIVESRPVDWWTGEPIDGEFIVLGEFLSDLESVKGASELTLRINSIGGDGYVSIAMHNKLRELPMRKTAIVDGVAMSGGSLIMCAADEVKVNPSSIIMIHKCWSWISGSYNADELREMLGSFEAMDASQMEIYRRKTGKSAEEILDMMAKTTHMTGREAVENGFADTLLDDDTAPDMAASADRKTLYVNGHAMRMGSKAAMEAFNGVKTAPHAVKINKPEAKEGGKPQMRTLEELRAENPELAEALLEEARTQVSGETERAVSAERQRIADIDAIAGLFDEATVAAAKYGDSACTAQEMAYRAAIESAKAGRQFMRDAASDYEESGAKNVGAAPAPEAEQPEGMSAEKLREAGREAARRNAKEGK